MNKLVITLLCSTITLSTALFTSFKPDTTEAVDNAPIEENIIVENRYNNSVVALPVHGTSNNVLSSRIIQPREPITITGIIGGMIIGWIVDGYIKYRTGYAPSEAIAAGMERLAKAAREDIYYAYGPEGLIAYFKSDGTYTLTGGCSGSSQGDISPCDPGLPDGPQPSY